MCLNFISGDPLQVSYFKSRQLKKKIDDVFVNNAFEMVYIFHLRMAQYFSQRDGIYKVLDLCDSVPFFMKRLLKHAKCYLKPVYAYEISRVRKYEKRLLDHFDEYWIISEEDRAQLEGVTHLDRLHIVRNGVDTDYFLKNQAITENVQNKALIFVGYMGVESVDAVLYFHEQILPMIKREIPDIKFFIVGANPPGKIKSLAADGNIIVAGYVDDLRKWYTKAAVAIAPMRFVAGMQNKILEAMSMSLPVVTTSIGNEGINANNGEEIFVENEPDHFAKRVVQLLKDGNLRKEIGNRARSFVIERYSWESVLNRAEKIADYIINQ